MMQRFDKGLSRDTRPQDQPPGTYPFGKNGLKDTRGVDTNEPGFLPSSAVIPYIPIGIIETDKDPVIISTNNTNTAIGYYNAETDVYIPIINDASLPFRIGFSTDWYVTGQAQRNYKGEIVIAFTDRKLFPMYLNCDNPNLQTIDDLRLFPQAERPSLQVSTTDGGILLPGAYYVLAKYLKHDGTETTFLETSDVIIVPGVTGENTGKALEIIVSDADTRYDLVEIGIISKIAGVIAAFTLDAAQLSSNGQATVIYTGANLTSTVTLEELLVDPVVYDKVQTLGQLNDALYMMNMERKPAINMQKYALLAKVRWVSELISLTPPNQEHAAATKRSFLHREVYALYIRYSHKGSGAWTEWFPLPGEAPLAGDLLQSGEATTGGLGAARLFQVEDTIHSHDAFNRRGTTGVWVNEDETYPDTEDFDASPIGGPNLRGQAVRHHRMPSLRWCKNNLYASDSEYGKSKLDLLGLEISNVVIPAEYADRLDGGYEIGYARRTIANMTVLGQSALLHAARKGTIQGQITGPDTNYISTGGNWHAQIDWEGSSRERPLAIDRSLFRFHAFDVLFNKPAISPDYICSELKLRRMNIPGTGGLLEDYYIPPNERNGPIAYLLDYVTQGAPPTASAADKLVRKITESQYVPNNLVVGKWKNIEQETVFGGKIDGPNLLDNNELAVHSLWTGNIAQRPDKVAQFETTFLVNLMVLSPNLYLPFNSQSMVRAGTRQTGTAVIFGGDSFVCDYTFHTYGWHDENNDTYAANPAAAEFMGIKVVRRIACESASNIYTRFETPGNIYSKWYPNSPLVPYTDANSSFNYINTFSRRQDPNQFGYNRDSNALNDLVSSVIYNPQREDIRVFPFRIHRTGRLSRQLKRRSWQTVQPLDFYEMQKNMGVGIHLEGMDDQLLIHMEHALFATQPKLRLEQDVLSVVIGSGDIFQFEPQEAFSSKLGYGGTSHQLACVRTPLGYIFVDAVSGQVFLYKDKLRVLNELLDPFLRQYLKVKGINPYTGDGITIGYDPDYERFLLTVKKLVLPEFTEYQPTQAYIDTLIPGESLVRKDGRLLRYLGPNDTQYDCPTITPTVVENKTITIPETTPQDTLLLTIAATSGENVEYYITGGNPDNAIRIEPVTGRVRVNNTAGIDYEVRQQIVLQVKAIGTGGTANFTITINITEVNEPPIANDQEFSIAEHAANGTVVGTFAASDPENDPLSFSITAGNDAGAFSINPSTGAIQVANSAAVDAALTDRYILTINISDGVHAISRTATIIIEGVDEAPALEDATINIWDTTATGTRVYEFFAQDPEGSEVRYEIVSESHPGVFSLNPTTGALTLVDNNFLDPVNTPAYTVEVRAVDQSDNQGTGTLHINVLHDPEALEFRPGIGVCSGGCPPGWTATPDGLACEKLTTIDATPPSGGPPIQVVAATNSAYSNFGMVIYAPGYNLDGTGNMQHWFQNAPVWMNPGNLADGPLNRCAVWGATAVPNNEPIGFSIPLVIAETKTFYIAIAGDNRCRIALNGTLIVDQDPNAIGSNMESQTGYGGQGIAMAFKIWHCYPVTLGPGTHFIGIEGVNFGGPAGFGFEIYDNTPTELQNAQLHASYIANPGTFPLDQNHYSNLNLVFSTRSTRGGSFTSGITGGYSCPSGYGLDGLQVPPVCVKVERIPAKQKLWTTVQIFSLRSGQVITTFNNTPGQTFQGIPVPVYAPVIDHVDCGGTVQPYYNVPASTTAQKTDCGAGSLGSVVRYSIPGGKYVSLVSQADANAQGAADLAANKQAYANANGFCTQNE